MGILLWAGSVRDTLINHSGMAFGCGMLNGYMRPTANHPTPVPP